MHELTVQQSRLHQGISPQVAATPHLCFCLHIPFLFDQVKNPSNCLTSQRLLLWYLIGYAAWLPLLVQASCASSTLADPVNH